MSFDCTRCGACCAKVQGEIYLDTLPVNQDGSCGHYNRFTKKCNIYEGRPDICRVDRMCPSGDYTKVYNYCDKIHKKVYGEPREQQGRCKHMEPSVRLQLETVSSCNARCRFCPYSTAGRAGGKMSLPLFRKIVDEAAGIRAIDSFSMQGLGEPLLDQGMEDKLRYIKATNTQSSIEMFTNGVALVPKRFLAIRDAGLDCLVVSLNAVNQKQHEEIMGIKNQFDRVCGHIDFALKNRGGCVVKVHAVQDEEHFTDEHLAQLWKRWPGVGRGVVEGNWSGDREMLWPDRRPYKANDACARAIQHIYVRYDGTVTTCCFDPLGKQIFGDLNKQTLRQVYASPHYVKFREDHAKNRADRWPQCRNCTRI